MAKKGFIGEFKDFISRGNAMDMAVGVIIGGAFSGIVTSLTEDIISPILGLFGGINFDRLSVNILGEVTLNYGKFITENSRYATALQKRTDHHEGSEYLRGSGSKISPSGK